MDLRRALIAAARIGLGWIFLWPFLDKMFGLGYTTERDAAYMNGGSPTQGFLQFGSDPNGPLHGLFQAMAGNAFVDFLFMAGLLLIGLALMLGIGVRIAAYGGALLLLLMWLAVMPMDKFTDHNPFWDDHLMYGVFLLLLPLWQAGDHYGLGKWWKQQKVVRDHPILE